MTEGKKAVQEEVLKQMGFDTSVWPGTKVKAGSPQEKEQQYIDSLIKLMNKGNAKQADYDAIMEKRAGEGAVYIKAYPKAKDRATFVFKNDDEVRTTFDNLWKNVYSGQVNAYLSDTLAKDSAFQSSKELIAIATAKWMGLMGHNTGAALSSGNRAVAWYELRYGWAESEATTNNPNNGWAKRTYFVSSMLGLYDDPAKVTAEEAKQTYKMLFENRDRIMQREFKYGVPPDGTTNSNNWISKANSEPAYKTVSTDLGIQNAQSIIDALIPAYDAFVTYATQLDLGGPIIDKGMISNAASIFFQGEDKEAKTLDARVDDDRTGNSMNNNLLVGGAGADKLYGGAGKDHLIGADGKDTLDGGSDADVLSGGKGDDTLKGGAGNNTLVGGADNDVLDGGADNDTYVFNSGDGADTVYITKAGNSVIDMGAGDDNVYTYAGAITGNLRINGGVGRDYLGAGSGQDVIEGGAGDNTLHGGKGGDLNVIEAGSTNTIVDSDGSGRIMLSDALLLFANTSCAENEEVLISERCAA